MTTPFFSTPVFFDGWTGVLRVVIVGVLAYAALLVMLRASGKRTLAKLSAFDFVVTIALGSTLSTVLLSADVALVEGIVAMVLLVALQYVVAGLSARSDRVESLVKSAPTLVYRAGFLPAVMRTCRVSEDDLRQAARTSGRTDLDGVGAIVLESDGTLSILDAAPASVAS